MTADDRYDCAYCPLSGIGTPVMLDGYPAHPDCAGAIVGTGSDPAAIRAEIIAAAEHGEIEL